MEFIKEWVTNIILFILFATMVDMLLPNSKFQKYTKMVIGLLLIAIILTPVLKLVSQDFEEAMVSIPKIENTGENKLKNLIELQKKEIQASQDAYIYEQMAVQLKEDVEEELMDKYGLVITDLKVIVDEENQRPFPESLQKVMISLNESKYEKDAVEVIKTIDIDTNQPLKSKTFTENNRQITKLLSKKWNVAEETIEIQIEGGKKEINESR